MFEVVRNVTVVTGNQGHPAIGAGTVAAFSVCRVRDMYQQACLINTPGYFYIHIHSVELANRSRPDFAENTITTALLYDMRDSLFCHAYASCMNV